MMKTKRAMTLRRKLIVTSYFSVLVPVAVLCVICYFLFGYNARRSQAAADSDVVLQLSENMNYAMYTTDALIRNIIYSSEIQQLMGDYTNLPDKGGSAATSIYYQLAVNGVLRNHSNNLTAITNATLYDTEGRLVASMSPGRPESIYDYPWFDQLAASGGESLWLTAYPETSGPHDGMVVPLAKCIRSLNRTNPRFGSEIGYFLVDVNLDQVWGSLEVMHYELGNKLYLLDGEGRILGGNAPDEWAGMFPVELSGQAYSGMVHELDGGEYMLTSRGIRVNGWYVACLTDYNEIMRDANLAVLICLIVAALLLVAFFFVSILNADSVVKPVTALRGAFRATETGDFTHKELPRAHILELDDLTERFGLMNRRLDALVHDVYASQLKEQTLIAEAQRSQIEALQMQINPHFIYNTLDSINWMAMMGGNEDVSHMVLALGEVLRFNVSIQQLYTSLGAEIANTERFMYIQRTRFQPRLDFYVDVPEALLGRKVLKLLVQPLVENAVRHGMEPSDNDCLVEVRISEREGVLFVEVRDDGVGMPPQVLDELQGIWRDMQDEKPVKDKVGIVNLMQRLYLCYGRRAGFTVESAPGKGTRVEMSFPAENFELSGEADIKS